MVIRLEMGRVLEGQTSLVTLPCFGTQCRRHHGVVLKMLPLELAT